MYSFEKKDWSVYGLKRL